MSKSRSQKHKKQGLAPGTPVYTGTQETQLSVVDVFHYSENKIEEKKNILCDPKTLFSCANNTDSVTWIDVSGLSQIDLIEKIGQIFSIHPLILEDIVQVHQRPKFEDYDDTLFFTLKMISWNEKNDGFDFEHVSFVVNSKHLLSFQELAGGDVFEWVRKRLRSNTGKIRKMGSDYLLFSLVDATVDGYFSSLENFSDKIQRLEQRILHNPTESDILEINSLRRDLSSLRKAILPLREALSFLIKTESHLVDKSTEPYWRDLYDHCLFCIDIVENDREVINGLMEIYLSSISHRMNEVMKFLTVFSTLFIPLTFIVGVYGMNFEFMPELHWKSGYVLIWLVMLTLSVSMILWFKKKKWL